MRAIVLVLDSVGIGAAPDAGEYGDEGSNTLVHCAEAVGGLRLTTLARMGLGNVPGVLPDCPPIAGVPVTDDPTSGWGAMREVSPGKDTTTGHWEIAGLHLKKEFFHFSKGPPSFPAELVQKFERRTGRALIGNKAASGTAIIAELGSRQIRDGSWIVYTSADSVFQIAAHEDVIPLDELYRACEIARELCNRYPVGRVIARPYVGEPGAFTRTQNRRDYAVPPPEPTVLERLTDNGITVTGVGKVEDIYAHRGFTTSYHTGSNREGRQQINALVQNGTQGLILANLNDFDSVYGHRRNPRGYANALEQTDTFLGKLLPMLLEDDLLIVTADHGNDPTFKGTDHTREFVPLLVYGSRVEPGSLGLRIGFYDVAHTLTHFFGLEPWPRGRSFVKRGRQPMGNGETTQCSPGTLQNKSPSYNPVNKEPGTKNQER